MTSTKFSPHTPIPGSTFANQDALPKLPIPPLEDTCKRYLTALRGLQDDEEHAATTRAVQSFLQGEGLALQERLRQWAAGRARYVCCLIPSISITNLLAQLYRGLLVSCLNESLPRRLTFPQV